MPNSKWNRDMVGIMVALSDKHPGHCVALHIPLLTYIPAALIRLAEEGCVVVGQQVRLTRHGRGILRIISATRKMEQGE